MTLGNTGRGGAQTFAMNVLKTIDRNRYQIDFIVENDPKNGYHDEMIALDSKIWIAPRFKIYNILSYIKVYRKVFSDGKYDIIHGNVSSSASVYLRLAKHMGLSTILHSHSSGYRGSHCEVILKKIFSKNAYKYADYWLACSDAAAKRLFGNRYKNYNKFSIIKNGIDVENYKYSEIIRQQIRKSLNISSESFVIGNVGSFSEAKNHMFLIDVFKKIHEEKENCILMLVGAGRLEKEIKERINEYGLTNSVILTGSVSNVGSMLMAMDVFVFPSRFEGLGIVAIEAQAAGLECICSDQVPIEAKICEDCYFLPLDDQLIWKNKILNSKRQRKDRSAKVIEAGYSIKCTVEQLSDVYNGLVIANSL